MQLNCTNVAAGLTQIAKPQNPDQENFRQQKVFHPVLQRRNRQSAKPTKQVAKKYIYSKTCPVWERLRRNTISTKTRCGQARLFEDVSRMGATL